MKILVTGASGFVGRHLVKELSLQHEVVAVSRSAIDAGDAIEIRHIPDINSSTDWTGVLEGVDVVVHLAARVHVMKESADDPLAEFRATNVEGTRSLAEAAAQQGVNRFVFISSIKVNGEGIPGKPYTAADLPSPTDPYGISKWEAEQNLRAISASTGLPVVIMRPPVIYGPGVKGNILRISRLVSTRVPLPFGAVDNRRSMISINNLIKWVERAICDGRTPEDPVLVADPEPVSTKLLVLAIAKGMGIRVRMLSVPVKAMEMAAAAVGKKLLAQKLLGDLELVPSFEQYAGIRSELLPAFDELQSVGRDIKRKI